MERQWNASLCILTMVFTFVLTGCGDSTPPSDISSAATSADKVLAVSSAPATKSTMSSPGDFHAISADVLKEAARISSDCALDAIGGQAPGSTMLDRTASPPFAGWVADKATGSVPASGKIVLKGTQDFALTFRTGSPKRSDVAKALNNPAFATSGFQIHGHLSSVVPGDYSVLILSTVAGQSLLCDTKKQVSVR